MFERTHFLVSFRSYKTAMKRVVLIWKHRCGVFQIPVQIFKSEFPYVYSTLHGQTNLYYPEYQQVDVKNVFFFRITIIFSNPFIKIVNICPSRCPKRRIFSRFHRDSVVSCSNPRGHTSHPPPFHHPSSWPSSWTTRSVPVAPPSRQVWLYGDEKVVQIRLFMTGQPTPALTYPPLMTGQPP